MGDMDTGQLTTVLFAKMRQGQFALQGHCVGHQPAAGAQVCPAQVQHPFAGDAAADEDGIGLFQALQCRWRLAADQLQAGYTQRVTVVFDETLAAFVGLDGQGAAGRVGAHPFDANRAAARAHVPQQLHRAGAPGAPG